MTDDDPPLTITETGWHDTAWYDTPAAWRLHTYERCLAGTFVLSCAGFAAALLLEVLDRRRAS